MRLWCSSANSDLGVVVIFWSEVFLVQYLSSSVFQFSSVAQSCLTVYDPMNCSNPGLPVHHQLPKFTQTHVHWVGDAISHLILCRPLLLLPPIPPSIRVFSNESTLRMMCHWGTLNVLKKWSSHHSQQKSLKCTTWIQFQKWQNDLCLFPRQTIQYHSNPSLCPNQ